MTGSFAVTNRARDATCLSVVSFNSTIPQAQFFITSYFGFGFTSAYNSILFCCLRRNVQPCCHTLDSALCRSRMVRSSASIALGRPIPDVNKKPATECKIQTMVRQLLIARPDNHWFRDFSLPHLHSTPPLGGFPSEYCYPVWCGETRMVWLPTVKKIWRYLYSFWQNVRMWQIHTYTQTVSSGTLNSTIPYTQTDTHTQAPHDGIGRAYA